VSIWAGRNEWCAVSMAGSCGAWATSSTASSELRDMAACMAAPRAAR
jgi:hypothetical protein